MPTITENDIEPCARRVGSEHTPAAALVVGEMSRDSLARCLPAATDVIPSVIVIGEGA
jgi:hypothetical protein